MHNHQLAKIKDVRLGRQGSIMTLSIGLGYSKSTGQYFGGYALDDWDEKRGRRVGTAAGMDFIMQILDLFHVDSLDKIIGRTVYALFPGENKWGEDVIGLQTPDFDGGEQFLIENWKREWSLPHIST